MSRLPTVTPKQMVRVLKRAGFVKSHQKGSHLYLFNPTLQRITSVAIHAKDLKRAVMKEILRQAGLSETEFRKLL